MKRKSHLRLFVWTDFARDYTGGLAVAIARDEADARKQIVNDMGYEVYDWGELKTYPLTRRMAKGVSGGG